MVIAVGVAQPCDHYYEWQACMSINAGMVGEVEHHGWYRSAGKGWLV